MVKFIERRWSGFCLATKLRANKAVCIWTALIDEAHYISLSFTILTAFADGAGRRFGVSDRWGFELFLGAESQLDYDTARCALLKPIVEQSPSVSA